MQSLNEPTKPRILVADDDSVIRHLVCRSLNPKVTKLSRLRTDARQSEFFKPILILKERFLI